MEKSKPAAGTGGKKKKPEILAPAGNRQAFLAAIAAGADAVYCGLKEFSARMAAENFEIPELARLAKFARERGASVYAAINTLVKPDELDYAGRLIDLLNRQVRPDGLIIQDLSILSLAQQAGYKGEIHLSTLSNAGFPQALDAAAQLPGVKRVVLPRELSIDEIKQMAARCGEGITLEVFVHGALCYAVSGRCYWSSYLGGKSGLRGRCVQPCRRMYEQGNSRQRFFSCRDLWLDVLARLPAEIPAVSALKIEGRKKGAHYVYHTVSAYKLIRDYPDDREMKKTASEFLDYALGRKGTHYYFLPQRPFCPVDVNDHTGSGLNVGRIQGPFKRPYIEPAAALYKNDVLRIGYEDETWHRIYRVRKNVPKKGTLYLNFDEKERPRNGVRVFLIDRREGELDREISGMEKELVKLPEPSLRRSRFSADRPQRAIRQFQPIDMTVFRKLPSGVPSGKEHVGLWMDSSFSASSLVEDFRVWYWLPPVLWPDEAPELSGLIEDALKKRCRNFVLNSPWQIMLFPEDSRLRLWAGPFCNITNELAAEVLSFMGFSGVIASPELGRTDYAKLPPRSPVPMGMVLSGYWPLCISRCMSDELELEKPFTSPKGEQAWARRYGGNYWVYPNWPVDLTQFRGQMKKIGYQMFVHIREPLPAQVSVKKRQGLWNWDIGLK